MNREDPAMQNREITVEIGTESHTIKLRKSPEPETFIINPPAIGDTVRVTVKSVYASCKNGGAINIYATKCASHAPDDPKVDPDPKPSDSGASDIDSDNPPEDPAACTEPSTKKLPKDPKIPPKEGEMIQALDDSNKKWVPAVVTKVVKKT